MSLLSLDDPLRFSKATPKEAIKTLNRLCPPNTGVSPKLNRIIQDVEIPCENILLIVKKDGDIVDYMADQNGHRKGKGPGWSFHKRLHPRPARKVKELELHPDAKATIWRINQVERPKWEANISSETQSD